VHEVLVAKVVAELFDGFRIRVVALAGSLAHGPLGDA
jgi:hypothetical protein